MPSSGMLTACASHEGPNAPPTSTSPSNGIRAAPGARRSSVLISSSVVHWRTPRPRPLRRRARKLIENEPQEGQVSMPAHLVLDIETIPDPELPRQDEGERVPPPPFNQIVTLGCLLLADYAPKRLGVVGEHRTEGEMLADFAEWLGAKGPTGGTR